MSAENHTYLITGANRGIGKSLLMTWLARPYSTVIAGLRDPSSDSSKALLNLPKGENSRILTVKIDSGSKTDAASALKTLETTYHIDKLDTVFANAGIAKYYGSITSVTAAQVLEHVNVNAIGPLLLFQAVNLLLLKSTNPKFVVMGSAIGSIGAMEKRPAPMFAYGASKAMVHYLVRKVHFENERITAFAIDPGFVQSDLGNEGASFFGMAEAPVPVKDSAEYLVAEIDGATRAKTSGRFPMFEGGEFAW